MGLVSIKSKNNLSLEDFKELWVFRELLYFFAWREIKVRYKRTIIGIGWVIFQPFITMVVFSIFFGKLAKIPSDGVPYPIFVFVGLIFWQFFSSALSDASNSLVSNRSIITKIYFPRLILPLSTVLAKFIDFFAASIILVGMMIYYHFIPSLLNILVLPLLLFISFLAASGGGLILGALNVKYRDVHYILPFFIQLLLFVTPVIYPASIAGKYSWILAFNPMTGVIKAAQAAIFGNMPINWTLLGISFAVCLVILIIGLQVFKKSEKLFADII
jgi:lipopolysaccharide transport system permease protein